MAEAPGIVTSFYRLFFGTLILSIPFGFNLQKKPNSVSFKGVIIAFFAGTCLAVDMAFWTTGLMMSNATLPTLVGNLAPVWVGIGTLFFFKEKHNAGFWGGLIIAFSGIFIMLLKDFGLSNSITKAVFLGLLAGFFYAGFLLLGQPGRKNLSTINYLFISTLSTSVVLFFCMLIFDLNFTGYNSKTWILWVVMGVVVQAGGWFFINYAQGFIRASIVSPSLLGQPVIAAIIAYITLGEQLTKYHIGGGIIILLGVYIVHFSRKK